jgi:hypothetical protein
MKNHLFTLATMFLVMLLMASLCEAQVASIVEIGDPPYEIGETFSVEFRLDATTADPPDVVRTLSILVEFTGTAIAPSDPPFSEINSAWTNQLDNRRIDGTNQLLLRVLGGGPPTDAGEIVIARAEFTQEAPGSSRLDYLEGDPAPGFGTRYSLASAPTDPIVPELQGTDVALPVQLSAFTVVPVKEGVIVKWQTESELNNLGFDVYRSESLDGTFVKVNQTRIQGAGTDATPHSYKFIDESVEVGKTYYYYIEDISYSGVRNRSNIIQVIVDATGKLKVIGLAPSKFALLQNYPNPFNPETWIPYQLSRNASVAVRIYNLKGQLIRTLALGQKTAGTYLVKDRAVYWNGRDDVGEKVTSGVYFYTLQAGEFMATRRMVIIK